ncbi:uncharacterized protein METZ01_LOCUS408711 [marine metagenome]|uniref:Uncharacterized protein n=1 Tax=marine metagenome TaxID=408172 RepID=A0A382WAH6_9ZZZZ
MSDLKLLLLGTERLVIAKSGENLSPVFKHRFCFTEFKIF